MSQISGNRKVFREHGGQVDLTLRQCWAFFPECESQSVDTFRTKCSINLTPQTWVEYHEREVVGLKQKIPTKHKAQKSRIGPSKFICNLIHINQIYNRTKFDVFDSVEWLQLESEVSSTQNLISHNETNLGHLKCQNATGSSKNYDEVYSNTKITSQNYWNH